ncbi:pebp-like protein [Stemphylium lycopersici]|uniref:Pebp-like protein n=1 Tax=Stemphylium lycopersici TaxID=183478 RepID=A0A364NFU5_STELY|nr:pebp-like protein [Stemphylium lycopersici]RAR03705.1 pebp-like protein [Stemphylium lycopersici]RAR16126.1 pebp-like protein [Stemphylium lycopersici]
MYFFISLIVATFVSFVLAQTPAGFTPQTNNKLEVIFNSTMVNKPGQKMAKTAVATQPQLALSSAMISTSVTYMSIMLDLDVPSMNGTERRVLLHSMNTGLKATSQQLMGAATLLASPHKGPATYIAPSPPPTDTVAHRYVELLFEQPCNLNVTMTAFSSIKDRIDFDMEAFMAEYELSTPLAANFFIVDSRPCATASGASASATVATAATTATGSGTIPFSTLTPFTGAAPGSSVPGKTAARLGGLALFALFAL